MANQRFHIKVTNLLSKKGFICEANVFGETAQEVIEGMAEVSKSFLVAGPPLNPQPEPVKPPETTPSPVAAPKVEEGERPKSFEAADGKPHCNAVLKTGAVCGHTGAYKPNRNGKGEFWACPNYREHAA